MTPAKVWRLVKGPFDLPEDEEFDARQAPVRPPVSTGWPYPTVCSVDYCEGGREVDHYYMKTEDGNWLEIIEAS